MNQDEVFELAVCNMYILPIAIENFRDKESKQRNIRKGVKQLPDFEPNESLQDKTLWRVCYYEDMFQNLSQGACKELMWCPSQIDKRCSIIYPIYLKFCIIISYKNEHIIDHIECLRQVTSSLVTELFFGL